MTRTERSPCDPDGNAVIAERLKTLAYDLMYRYGAPWDAVGVRGELREFLDQGSVSPETHPRAVDLGCGTGANAVFLAEQGFESHGVDLSPVALEKARERARTAGVGDRVRFVRGDLTARQVPGLDGPFDLLLDFARSTTSGRWGGGPWRTSSPGYPDPDRSCSCGASTPRVTNCPGSA